MEIEAVLNSTRALLFILSYVMVLTFESVNDILKRDHTSESYYSLLSCCAVYFSIKSGFKFLVCGRNP